MLTQARAIEIFENCKRAAGYGPWSDQLRKNMSDDERREVMSLWDTMDGSTCFADAFFCFVHGLAPSQATPRDVFADIVAAGIQYDHHASDLYVPDTPQTRAIIASHSMKGEPFTSQIDGKPWLDVPFAYSPWWQDKQRTVKA